MKKLLLLLAFVTTNLMAQNQLTLYFIPSPVGMDWSSPANLAWTALKNKISFKPHFMGHVFVEFQCGQIREVTGMTSGQNFDYFNQLVLKGRGLGIIYHSFDGKLELKEDVEAELTDYYKNGGINFARFILNDGQCQRLTEYLKVYREKNVGRYYGLANRPRYGEGAGCSAFGASFPDVAGILNQDLVDAWSNSVNIPLEYAGPPLTEEFISIFKLMMNAGSWAKENEAHKKIFFWDPDRMYNWVNEKINQESSQYKVTNMQNVRGVVFDKSHLPAPMGPIWLQHTENIKK